MFIILMVITAASTMQSVGGIDYLVEVAKKLLKRKPAYIALIAPIVAFVFTMGAGTGFIYYSLIPVIFAVAYANKVRPERPLAVAGTASQFAITASPVSAAMATLVGLLDPVGFGIGDILIVVLPASIVGLLVACFVQMRVGKELDDDPEYQRRVAAGEIPPFDESVLEERELPPYAKRSTMIFLAGIGVIVVLGMVERLRPAFPDEAGNLVPLSTGIIIQIVMGVVATVIVLTCRVNIKDVVGQSTMLSGLVGLIALFGIAWLADTWIAANETAIVNAMGERGRRGQVDDRPGDLHRRRVDHQPGGGAGGDRPDRPGARGSAAVPGRVLHGLHRHLLLPGQRLAGDEHRDRRDGHHPHQQVRHLALVLVVDVHHVARVDRRRHGRRDRRLRHVVQRDGAFRDGAVEDCGSLAAWWRCARVALVIVPRRSATRRTPTGSTATSRAAPAPRRPTICG